VNPNPAEVFSPRRRLQLKPKAVYICGLGEGEKRWRELSHMNRKFIYFLAATMLLYCSVFLTNYLVSINTIFHYGKDDGLVFRILSLCIFSSIFFLIIKKRLKFLIAGFFIGLGSYLFLFSIYISENIKTNGDNNHFYLSMLGDEIFSATMVFIIGLLFRRNKTIS